MKKICLATASLSAIALGIAPAMAQTAGERPTAQAGSSGDTPAAAGDATGQDQEADIIVTGLRSSLSTAQEIKRNSIAVVDSIVAQDIGKLPDNNAAEAIARITGVQVTRFQDEAQGVLIRGLPNVETVLNGREIFTADGRTVALQDFPADSLKAVDVYKSTTADNIEGGIAGLINVRLRRPFDFDGFTVAGGVRGIYNDESKKADPQGNLLISNRFDTSIGEIGVLLNASFTSAHYLNSVRYDGYMIAVPAGQSISPASIGRNFVYPQDVGIYYGLGYRQRPSVNGSIQWKPSDNLEIYVDGLWQGFRGRDQANFFGINLSGSSLTGVTLTSDGVQAQTASAVLTGASGPSKWITNTDTNTYQGAVGAIYTAGNAKFTTDLAYTNSQVSSAGYNFDTYFRTPPTINVTFMSPSYGVEFNLPGTNLNDPNTFTVRGLQDQRSSTRGKSWQWRGDLDLDTGSSLFPHFLIGLRYSDRDASSNYGTRYASFPASAAIPFSALPNFSGAVIPAGFTSSSTQPTRTWYMATADYIIDNIAALRQFAAARGNMAFQAPLPVYNPLSNYAARERIYTTYAQLNYAFEVGTIPVDGALGVRVALTRNTLQGTASDRNGVLSGTNANQQYVDILPNASLRAHLTDKLQLRLSRTEAVSRPGYNQINPALVINQGTEGGNVSFTASGGNPDLQPIRSNNYDASLEYYFSRTGSVTVGGFYRQINGYINTLRAPTTLPGFADPIGVFRPVNAGSGKIKGVEAAFTTFFDFLPGWLSGFGTQVNGTYIDGSQTLVTNLQTGASSTTALPGVSKWTYNLIGLYEKGPLSMRVAYNHRTGYVNSFTAGNDPRFQTDSAKAVGRLDFYAGYDVIKDITLSVEATNLLKVPYENYLSDPRYPRDVRYEGRTFTISARARF